MICVWAWPDWAGRRTCSKDNGLSALAKWPEHRLIELIEQAYGADHMHEKIGAEYGAIANGGPLRRWRWPRYSVQMLLTAVLMFSAFLGGWTSQKWWVRRQLERAQRDYGIQVEFIGEVIF